MTPVKTEILEAIRDIISEKKKEGKHPTFALSPEIFRRVKCDMKTYQKSINELLREKKITYGKSLNYFYFKIREE